MNQTELIRVVVCQYAFVLLASCGGALISGMNAALSALVGGLCIALPNSFLAMTLVCLMSLKTAYSAYVVLVGEFTKMVVSVVLLFLVAKFYGDVLWPAVLLGIIAAIASNFATVIFKH